MEKTLDLSTGCNGRIVFTPSSSPLFLLPQHSFCQHSDTVFRRYEICSDRLFGEPSESLDEIHGCPTKQIALPKLGTCLQGHTGIQISERSILVCGGTNDEGHDPRICLLLELGSQEWVAFNYTMNEPRIQAHSKINGKKVLVIGGIDSHVNNRCKTSQEVFNLEDPERGWQLEPSEKEDLCFPTDVILEIPCE